MKVLFHVATDNLGNPLTATFIDGNGKRYDVPCAEATEIESDYMADKIVEHCHYFGMIEVHVTKTPTGRKYDIKEAEGRAAEALLASEKQCINDYLTVQLESRVAENKPPLPPKGRQLDCVIKHKFNLLRAGIKPVGWEPPYHVDIPEENLSAKVGGIDVQAQLIQLQNDNRELNRKLNELMQARLIDDATRPKTGKVKVGQQPDQVQGDAA